MAEVIFYEKPGCINNTKQKRLLTFAGHLVVARNLLTEAWSSERLQPFFSSLPVSEWFNRSAPQVTGGKIDPDSVTADEAIRLIIAEPLLIRRPLMVIDGQPVVGFDAAALNHQFSLGLDDGERDLESCPKKTDHEEMCEVSR